MIISEMSLGRVINFSREKGQSPAFARKSMRFDSGMQGYLAITMIEVTQGVLIIEKW